MEVFDIWFGGVAIVGAATTIFCNALQQRPIFWYADDEAVKLSKPNWGWPQTVGYENPTGPEVSYLQIFYSLPPIRWLLGNGPAKYEATRKR